MPKATSPPKKKPHQRNPHQPNPASFYPNRISRQIKRCWGEWSLLMHRWKSTLRDLGRWGRFLSLVRHVAFGLVFSLPCATISALAFVHRVWLGYNCFEHQRSAFLPSRRGPLSHLGPQHVTSVLRAASPFSLKKKKDKKNVVKVLRAMWNVSLLSLTNRY